VNKERAMAKAMTRDELIAALTEQRQLLEQWFAARTPEEVERPLTDSEVAGGERWRAKDHLAHAVGTERYLRGVAQRTLAGAEDPAGFYTQLGSLDRGPLMQTINQANERAYAKYHDEPVEALLARLRQTREETLAYLATLSDEQLAQPSPHSPFGHGTVRDLFRQIYRHDRQHVAWLTAALAGHDEHQPFSL
jgi:CelD/BcsL family acetyltransferase involved in cellulose biosynthesis